MKDMKQDSVPPGERGRVKDSKTMRISTRILLVDNTPRGIKI